MLAAISPKPSLLAHHKNAQLAVLDALALTGRAEVDAIIVVPDEQQRRVDPRFARR